MADGGAPMDEYEAERFLQSPRTRRMLRKLDSAPDDELESIQDFERHPLYRKAVRFGAYVHRVARLYRPRRRKKDAKPVEELVLDAYLAGAMIAAGTGRIDDAELGFSIAYLKRALRSTHLALQSLHAIREGRHLPPKAVDHVTARLVSLRDDCVSEVMTLRQEWRAKFAGGGRP
jgi:hypothetical protein